MKENTELNETLAEVCKIVLTPRRIIRGISFAIVLALLVGIWLYGYTVGKNKSSVEIEKLKAQITKLEETPLVTTPITPEIVQDILNEKTTEISELATAEYQFTNSAKFTDTSHINGIFDWITKKSFIQKWDGLIKAGIDLSKVEVYVKNDTIKITIPYATILSYEIDYNSVEVLDEKNNIFNPISVNDKVNFDRETKYEMEARAVKNGLLEKALKNAENVITNILKSSIKNIEDYKIEFEHVDK